MINVKNVGQVVLNPPGLKARPADAPGRGAWRVRPAIARHRGVKAAHAYWGRPDVIAFAETASPMAPSELLLPRIQRVRGVEATDSRIVLDV